MLRKTLLKAAVVVTMSFPMLAHSEFYDGYRLKEWSDADDRTESGNVQATDYQQTARLGGYIVGVYDTLDGVMFCAPNGVKVGQLIGMVKQYIRANPSKWNKPASSLVVDALAKDFPCKKK